MTQRILPLLWSDGRGRALDVFVEALGDSASFLYAIATFLAFIATWRLFRFTLVPIFYRNDPAELPYWIPVIGHLLAFFGDSDTLLFKARLYFGNTREPFALTVAGLKTYVITQASHVGEIYRNTETLSYEEFVQMMMQILGNSKSSIKAMFTPLPRDKEGFPNPHGKPLGILFRSMHIHQLFPGKNLSFLESHFYEFFDQYLQYEKLNEACGYAKLDEAGAIVIPLVQWCSDYFVKAGQIAYFGPKLGELDSTLTDAFLVFDELSYQVIYQYPHFLSREMRNARDRLLQGLKKYLQLPPSERADGAWFVEAMEKEMRNIGLSAEDMAVATMTIYWAINTNSRKAAYWLLAYLLQRPALLDVIRQETEPSFHDDHSINFDYLHQSVPQLDAMWNEMLRLSSFAASVRYIAEDTTIGNKVLRKGNRLIIPYRQLHMDEHVYGNDVNEFNHTRFLKKPRLSQGNSFRPFGGGNTMCPGRHIAKRAVFLFITIVLHRFDVELVDKEATLLADLTKPVPGLMSPKADEEIYVKLTPRKGKV